MPKPFLRILDILVVICLISNSAATAFSLSSVIPAKCLIPSNQMGTEAVPPRSIAAFRSTSHPDSLAASLDRQAGTFFLPGVSIRSATSEFSSRERASWIRDAPHEPIDVLIMGAGVAGGSIAAHLAKLGLKVTLVEKSDIASGASSHSSGLAHAGLRYLLNIRFWPFVLKESRERRRTGLLAPHWVRTHSFLFPVYKGDPYPIWLVWFGTWIYDGMSRIEALFSHAGQSRSSRRVTPREVGQRIPQLKKEGLKGAAEYYMDGELFDSRYTLGFSQYAAQKGARILTRVVVDRPIMQDAEGFVQIPCRDELTQKRFTLKSRLIINATGASIDQLRSQAGFEAPQINPSQGVHLIINHRLSNQALILSKPDGRGVFFILPYGRDKSLVGTTDTPLIGPTDTAGTTAEDINELIWLIFAAFPGEKPEARSEIEAIDAYRVNIHRHYWGLRPLVRDAGASTWQASRDHKIIKDSNWFWSVPGVKLTAARAAGEKVAKEAYQILRQLKPSSSLDLGKLPGGTMEEFEFFYGIQRDRYGAQWGQERIRYLSEMYGELLEKVLSIASFPGKNLAEGVMPGKPWLLAEADYAARYEMVLTLNDFLWRRTRWAYLVNLPDESVRRVAKTLGRVLQWSPSELETQIASYFTELVRHSEWLQTSPVPVSKKVSNAPDRSA